MAGASQVFSTTELLEDILLRVPPKDVLLLQRVCQGWKSTIIGSLKLQRLLFFRPAGKITDGPSRASYLNPMMSLLCDHINHSGRTHKPLLPADHPFFHPSASWQRMYLTKPPLRTLTVRVNDELNRYKATRHFGTTSYDFYQDCWWKLRSDHSIDMEETLVWFRELDDYAQLERLSK